MLVKGLDGERGVRSRYESASQFNREYKPLSSTARCGTLMRVGTPAPQW